MAHLMMDNMELQKKMKDNPERDADQEEMDYEVLKQKYKKYQKALRRVKTEVSKEIEIKKELVRAREQAIDDICSHLVSLHHVK